MFIYQVLDIVGTITLAISGAIVGAKKGFDWFGIAVVAFLTATGGGSIRDVILGNSPSWISSAEVSYVVLIGVLLTIIFYRIVLKIHRALFLFDTIGISLTAIAGCRIALEGGATWPAALILGVVSCVLGGVMRYTLCNEIPLVFRKEIYAMACVSGILVFLLLNNWYASHVWPEIVASATVFTVRIMAVKFKISLPNMVNRV